jgi:RNA polymerase sigma-70 factor (ECF subfamily)
LTLETVSVESTDRELISRAQGGESAAFEALVYRYDKKVLAIAASYTSSPDEAKDIYQEVFLRVYRALAGFEFRSEFSTWLYRIVTNVCLTHQMRNKGRSFTSIDEIDHFDQEAHARTMSRPRAVSPERYAQDSEISRHIEDAMGCLSPQQRLVFTLKHYQGYKLREIASMMDCAEGTVKKYLFTATEKLRQRLKKFY